MATYSNDMMKSYVHILTLIWATSMIDFDIGCRKLHMYVHVTPIYIYDMSHQYTYMMESNVHISTLIFYIYDNFYVYNLHMYVHVALYTFIT